jgi:hypothetical protein
MKRFLRLALLTLPLALAPSVGLAAPDPLSVASGDPHFDFQDLPIIFQDFSALIRAEEERNQAAILADEAALEAAIDDFLTGVPASPAV